jgi:Na+/alanine symporter
MPLKRGEKQSLLDFMRKPFDIAPFAIGLILRYAFVHFKVLCGGVHEIGRVAKSV